MAMLGIEKLNLPRKICASLGIGLLALSFMLFASTLVGLLELDTFAVSGQSGIRTLAAAAVMGCLLAAIGFFDE